MPQLKVKGRKTDIQNFKSLLEKQKPELPWIVSISNPVEPRKNPLSRRPQGIEPLTYFVVVFSAHLLADLTIEGMKKLLKKKAEDSEAKVEVDVDESEESSE